MRYIKLKIKSLEPLCISDDSSSQNGQTKSCRFIPGSSIRGYVISSIADDEVFFERYKKVLFSSKICFMNAYPADGDKELMPSLKGFYENKSAGGYIQNVVINGKFDEGMKRAGLGSFCHVERDTIRFYGIETESLMKILTGEDQKVFRGEYIVPGYSFVSYIAINDDVDDELTEKIKYYLEKDYVFFGNMRSQGFGKCRIKIENNEKPDCYDFIPAIEFEGDSLYMVLLSDMSMRGMDGEYCGIDTDKLASELKVGNIEVEHCATSIVFVHGYNSKLGIKTPTVPMYEKGSVFKLDFSEKPTIARIRHIMDTGIGERRNEGFGRILFTDVSYEKINRKIEDELKNDMDSGVEVLANDEDRKVIKSIAGMYIRKLLRKEMQKRIPEEAGEMNITKSQMGMVLSILEKNRYNSNARSIIERYFTHAEEKDDNQNIQKERVSIKSFSKKVNTLIKCERIEEALKVNKERIMGYRIDELIDSVESKRMIVEYVIDLIKYAGKEG